MIEATIDDDGLALYERRINVAERKVAHEAQKPAREAASAGDEPVEEGGATLPGKFEKGIPSLPFELNKLARRAGVSFTLDATTESAELAVCPEACLGPSLASFSFAHLNCCSAVESLSCSLHGGKAGRSTHYQ